MGTQWSFNLGQVTLGGLGLFAVGIFGVSSWLRYRARTQTAREFERIGIYGAEDLDARIREIARNEIKRERRRHEDG